MAFVEVAIVKIIKKLSKHLIIFAFAKVIKPIKYGM